MYLINDGIKTTQKDEKHAAHSFTLCMHHSPNTVHEHITVRHNARAMPSKSGRPSICPVIERCGTAQEIQKSLKNPAIAVFPLGPYSKRPPATSQDQKKSRLFLPTHFYPHHLHHTHTHPLGCLTACSADTLRFTTNNNSLVPADASLATNRHSVACIRFYYQIIPSQMYL